MTLQRSKTKFEIFFCSERKRARVLQHERWLIAATSDGVSTFILDLFSRFSNETMGECQ